MGLLKRKQEKTTTLGIRVGLSVKAEVHALKQVADQRGFDLTVSLGDAVVKWIRQVREELGDSAGHKRGVAEKGSGILANGRGE